MSYRRILVSRWSRRDRFAIAMVALTVAFLTGSTLLVLTASAQPIGLADPLNSPERYRGPLPMRRPTTNWCCRSRLPPERMERT
ncbi:hypothetical protein [Halalkalicoccus salilacus]|uniref:hypothetical protein n=1 Tax=Halalkalicoccus sp. GCM10025704 TaxID=3252662 RepID=UPI00361C7741